MNQLQRAPVTQTVRSVPESISTSESLSLSTSDSSSESTSTSTSDSDSMSVSESISTSESNSESLSTSLSLNGSTSENTSSSSNNRPSLVSNNQAIKRILTQQLPKTGVLNSNKLTMTGSMFAITGFLFIWTKRGKSK